MIKFTLHEFPTHIAKTNNKVAANKMLKINNQAIYNGYINRFTRNTVIGNMHDWIKIQLLRSKPYKIPKRFPISILFKIYTVKNHGSISMRSGKLCWKPAKKDYVPNWDIENLASIWIKAFNDSLVLEGIIPDDSIQYVSGVSYNFIEIENINDRKIEVCIG